MTNISNSADNEAIRELRDELKDLSKSLKNSSEIQKRFTGAMFVLAMVQMIFTVVQVIISFAYSGNTQLIWFGIVFTITPILILVYFFRKIFPKDASSNQM